MPEENQRETLVPIYLPERLVLQMRDAINKGYDGFVKQEIQNAEAKPTSGESVVTDIKAPFPIPLPKSGFKFGATSKKELVGVKPELVRVARRALELTTQDFMIFDGLRTLVEQRHNVATGVSKTMASKHLPQADGLSHAFDAVPTNAQGKPTWDWELIYLVTLAVDSAATELGFASQIRWGGAWDRTLADFGGNVAAYRKVVEDYCARHPGKDFIDGPHFEWVS